MMPRFTLLHPEDNVAVALEPASVDDEARLPEGQRTTVLEAIPFAHKMAVRPIERGEEIRKYGEVIGEATCPIAAGQHVHVHNIKSRRA